MKLTPSYLNFFSYFLSGTFLLLFSICCYSQKPFTTDDEIYNKNIKTVLLYPSRNGAITDVLNPPIVPIDQSTPLVLEFDELGTEFKNYYVKIFNCNADWTISSLSAIQYMEEYNEFFINDRKISVGTRFPYIHYKFFLPKVFISGNYIVKVYRDYNEDDYIISRRFSVFENTAGVSAEVKFSTDPSVRNINQQIDFNIDYSKLDIINPMQSIKVFLRQNHRWDKTISTLRPVTVNQEIRRLEYFYFNRENNFKGGNEFRIIDIKSSNFNGYNIAKVKRDSNRSEAIVYTEKSRATEAYSQPLIADFDGKFIIQNYETGDAESYADYMYVTFSFESEEPANGKVYVIGGMTDWKLNKSFEMTYNSETKKYTCQGLLKQGVYNYIYVLANPTTKQIDETIYEGSHSITQNNYDILVYYRPFGARSDLLIGYKNVNYLGRR
jgi:hypothetical protein